MSSNGQNNTKLLKAKQLKDDEFYTPYEQFECWLKKCLLDKLQNKIIYCPCDAEWSNIVKVLRDYKDVLKYKELIYTSDDFRTHDDLFMKCDVVITNPPFSLSIEFYKKLKEHNCKFFIYGDKSNIWKIDFKDDIVNFRTKCLYSNEIDFRPIFKRPDGQFKKISYHIYTNIDGINMQGSNDIEFTKTLKELQLEGKCKYTDYQIVSVDNWREYPKDYYGLAVISPIRYMRWFDKLDIISTDRNFVDKLAKMNGEYQYIRWLVSLKRDNIKKDTKINYLF